MILKEKLTTKLLSSTEIIRNRIDAMGVTEPVIQTKGNNQIVIEIAGIQDTSRAESLIKNTGKLEFKLVKDNYKTWSKKLNKLKEIVIENNLKDNVEFTGWVDRNDIPKNIADASIGIGPLRLTDVTAGALPIKVLEYMAVSLPIIAQKGTLPDDVLVNEKNGYFIDGEDELAEKIITLLNDPKKIEEMGKNSLKMAQKFSWDNVVSQIIQISKN